MTITNKLYKRTILLAIVALLTAPLVVAAQEPLGGQMYQDMLQQQRWSEQQQYNERVEESLRQQREQAQEYQRREQRQRQDTLNHLDDQVIIYESPQQSNDDYQFILDAIKRSREVGYQEGFNAGVSALLDEQAATKE